MRALDRKVVRDLWHLRGQVIAIGMVIAAGTETISPITGSAKPSMSTVA